MTMAHRTGNRERGSAAVEFALVLPVLILLIFGIIDFGRMLSAKIILTDAAREGARAAALVSEDEGREKVESITSTLDGPINPPEVVGCPDPPDPEADATVRITYDFRFITPLSALAGLADIELEANGLMPCL
jgi:hypothetical protein